MKYLALLLLVCQISCCSEHKAQSENQEIIKSQPESNANNVAVV